MDYKGLKELLEGCIKDKCEEFPTELDDLIADTARTGIVRLQWELLKPLFNYTLQKVFGSSFDDLPLEGEDKTFSQQLLDQLNKFDNPPFTIQRICELIVDPKKNYKKRDKFMRAIERCLLVVSTQEPDLSWMKCPRLTQLLEEPPKEGLQEVVFDENMVNEFSSSPASGTSGGVWSNLRQINDDSEQPSSPSEPDQFNQTRKPVSPVTRNDNSGDEEASTSMVEDSNDEKATTATKSTLIDDCSDSTPESSSNSPERGGIDEKPMEGVQPFPLSRKRSSSMRESLESSSGEGGSKSISDDNDRGTVLQEADSTTLGEQDENGREEGDSEEGEMAEGDGDLEQLVPQKRLRSKSPEAEAGTSEAVGGVVGGVSDGQEKEVEAVLTHSEVEKTEVESKGSLKVAGVSSREEESETSEGELHSSSERETSTGQLERSHDLDSAVTCDEMETSSA